VVEYLAGAELALWPLHLAPVALVARFAGRRAAMWVVASAAVAWLVVELARGGPSSWPAWLLELGVRLAVLATFGALISAWTRSVGEREAARRTDPVTGAVNERAFLEIVESEVTRARRYHRPFTLACLSVNEYEAVARRFGAGAGETLVRETAAALQANLRAVDSVARLRGAVFTLLLPETEPEAARVVLQKLREQVVAPAAGGQPTVSVSVGAVTWVDAQLSVPQLLQRAYQLMYVDARREGSGLQHQVIDAATPRHAGAGPGHESLRR